MSDEQQKTDLPAPPGYTRLVPFSREQFRGMGRRRDEPYAFAAELNSVLLTAVEFFHAARHYPIVFGRDGQTGDFVPVAITGLEDRQNLFVTADGHWRAGSYVPAYARRWPFFTAHLKEDAERFLVCVDPAGLEPSDKAFVDANGESTTLWQEAERMINEMDVARRQTQGLGRALKELDLIEPFEAHALARNGGNLRLGNMLRVSEVKLNKLPEKQIKQLMTKGYLSRIYAHLISLENFQRLLDLRLEREQHRGEA